MTVSKQPLVISIVGSTATGKSDLALDLAQRLGGEIINADSMQIYRGMDIGTAKVPIEQRRGIPHHLLDLWDVTEPANVAAYQRLARQRIDEIHGRGLVAVVVGGSGLYVRSIFDDLDFPGTDAEVRARLHRELDSHGVEFLYARLADLDAAAAAAILPTNARRIVRALEVIAITGQPFTATLPTPVQVLPSIQIGLRRERATLDARIDSRVDDMWSQGLVSEVHGLIQAGLREGITARQALGYAQVLQLLDGAIDEQAAIEQTKSSTRKFARRQESWFKRDSTVVWLDAAAGDLVDQALAVCDASTVSSSSHVN
ncbi:MAG: tRNA (adenosine(37)-N6)-dimethylallyltransferase MiaA [Actinobacteria bacterium]|nr:tRNA (adenosine(37)-N6)-dimethylallyltransferase MiaA [Actinomycetota bacterium]